MSAGLLVSADSFLFGNCHLKLICEGFRLHEESPLIYGTRFPCTTRSNPRDEAPMTTESSPAHLPPFPSFSANLFYSQVRRINFPWLFLKAFPIPLICMLNCLLTLLPPVGQARKPSQIFPKSFSSSLLRQMTHQNKSILFLAVLMVSDSWRKVKLSTAIGGYVKW